MTISEDITYLIERRYPAARKRTTGNQLGVTKSFDVLTPEQRKQVAAYRAELKAMAPDEVQLLCAEERAKARLEAEAEREASFRFNKPTAMADFDYWARAAFWSGDEAVALSFGRDPGHVSLSLMREHSRPDKPRFSRFAFDYVRRSDLVSRAISANILQARLDPRTFIRWADAMGIDLPAGLREAVSQVVSTAFPSTEQILAENARLKVAYEEVVAANNALSDMLAKEEEKSAELNPNSRNSCLKIILAMAVKKYRYVPGSPRNSATTNIADDVQELGLTIEADTVRAWLKEASELYPPGTP